MTKIASSHVLLLFLFVITAGFERANAGGEKSLRPEQCESACEYRCSATSHRKPCMFFCKKCCAVCLCVPSGTYGNKEECPCYNDWLTQDGKPICP